jgi:hypothetical protein
LKAVVQFQRAKNTVLSQQVRSFQSARANEKPRKKTKVKGSAKVYTKEEVDAIQKAVAEKERLKDLQLAKRAVQKLQASKKKAEEEALRQRRQEGRIQLAANGVDMNAAAVRPGEIQQIRTTRATAAVAAVAAAAAMAVHCELNVGGDVFQ